MRYFGWRRKREKKATATSRAIVRKLLEMGETLPCGEDDIFIERTYAGYWQRTQGAWSWFLNSKGDTHEQASLQGIGSCEPASWAARYGIQDLYQSPGGLEIIANRPNKPATKERDEEV